MSSTSGISCNMPHTENFLSTEHGPRQTSHSTMNTLSLDFFCVSWALVKTNPWNEQVSFDNFDLVRAEWVVQLLSNI